MILDRVSTGLMWRSKETKERQHHQQPLDRNRRIIMSCMLTTRMLHHVSPKPVFRPSGACRPIGQGSALSATRHLGSAEPSSLISLIRSPPAK